MAKICVKNESKAVKVLKAFGMAPLRLFPGYNYVEKTELEKYFKNNPAAEGIRKECLSIVKSPTTDQSDQAKAAEKKNNELNKAKKIIQKRDEQIAKNKEDIAENESVIEELKAENAEKDKELAELNKRIAALEKAAEKSDKTDDK